VYCWPRLANRHASLCFGAPDLSVVAYRTLFYGGVPYIALALWATWWIGGRPEPEIRRLMFLAPLFMLGVFVPLALLVGLVVGPLVPWVGVAGLGAIVIVVLGYSYVGLTEVLRLAARNLFDSRMPG
jgi:hypothetical protein